MSKKLFEKLQVLNDLDTELGSSYLQVCGDANVISIDKKGDHGKIKVGVPPHIPLEIMQGKDLRVLLLVIDGERFDSLQ